MIYDWKRVKEIAYEAFGNATATSPHLPGIPNSNFWHYTLQLNVYRWFLQRHYGLKIVELCIVIFHPNNTNYQMFHLDILDDEIQGMLDARKRAIEMDSKNPVEFKSAVCLLDDD
jgi:hypothetical protein